MAAAGWRLGLVGGRINQSMGARAVFSVKKFGQYYNLYFSFHVPHRNASSKSCGAHFVTNIITVTCKPHLLSLKLEATSVITASATAAPGVALTTAQYTRPLRAARDMRTSTSDAPPLPSGSSTARLNAYS